MVIINIYMIISSITPYQFFFDGQQKRYLEQLVRAFSGFSYQTGLVNGVSQIVQVPCHLAYTNRQVAYINNNNSENTLNTIPMITIFQSGLRGRREDLQDPTFVDHLQVFERNITNGQYGPNRGNAYSVDRLMPLPFTMDIQVDVVTSNLEQKHQLSEQILVAMYPQFQIQNSVNALDWTANTICFFEDDITFSSRTFPVGQAGSEELDVMTFKLRMPIYLTPPAKVKKLKRIEEVVANVGDQTVDQKGEKVLGTIYERVIVTHGNYFIRVDGNVVTLLGDKAADTLPNGAIPSWIDVFNIYGIFKSGVSELHLLLTSDPEGAFVSGTFVLGSNPNEIVWTIDQDTLPANTLEPVDAVINPQTTFPGQQLPSPVNGVRYLLVEDMGNSSAWGTIAAHTNDIIQYSSLASQWLVSFNSKLNVLPQNVLNLYSGRQLKWNGVDWIMAIDTFYSPGYWRLVL